MDVLHALLGTDQAPTTLVVDRQGLEKAIRLRGRRGRPLRQLPRFEIPMRPEREYDHVLMIVVDELRGIVRRDVVPAIASIVALSPLELRGDARLDASSWLEQLDKTIALAEEEFAGISIDTSARRVAGQVSDANLDAQKRMLRVALGVQPELTERWLPAVIDHFVAENARLVSKVGEGFFGALEQRIGDGVRTGLRAEAIETGIAKDFIDLEGADVVTARNRAHLIARDQVGSFNGDLTRVRQRELGIERYRWRTSRDERVRESHREREGEIFEWGRPIEEQLAEKGLTIDKIDGPPGRPIRCRCTAEPVLADLLGGLPSIEGQP